MICIDLVGLGMFGENSTAGKKRQWKGEWKGEWKRQVRQIDIFQIKLSSFSKMPDQRTNDDRPNFISLLLSCLCFYFVVGFWLKVFDGCCKGALITGRLGRLERRQNISTHRAVKLLFFPPSDRQNVNDTHAPSFLSHSLSVCRCF